MTPPKANETNFDTTVAVLSVILGKQGFINSWRKTAAVELIIELKELQNIPEKVNSQYIFSIHI